MHRGTPSSPSLRFRTARDAEDYLLGFVNYELRSDYRQTTSTHDIAAFARRLRGVGWVPGRVPTVHVGGTNGKGTVSHLIERVLRAGGLRTGLYTSPHVHGFRERIRLGGRPLRAERFRGEMERLARVFSGAPEAGFRTTFEYLTALAFLVFQEDRVERAVVEVGLGGRLDATNILPPGPVVFTPVSLDHRDVLGRTVGAIARDKAAILKRGGRAYLLPQSAAARREILRRAARVGAPWVDVARVVSVKPVVFGATLSAWHVRGREDYGIVETRLLGPHQGANLAGAVAVAEDLLEGEALRVAVRRGLARAAVPGRLEPLRKGRTTYVLDGGHNPAAARAVARAIAAHLPRRRVVAVVGMARDKDHAGFLRALAPVVERFVLTRVENPRAASGELLLRSCPGRAEVAADVEEALTRARRNAPIVLVTGSFVLVGAARRILGRTRA